MSQLQASAPTVVGQLQYGCTSQKRAKTASLQCLVLSVSSSRRNMLSDSATEAGWETVVCADASGALAVIRRTSFQLALVDLETSGGSPFEFRQLCEKLADESPQVLLGICGQESCPEEEIWARQLGCWLYLPCVTNSMEMSLLCEQAREAVDSQRPFSTRSFH